MYIDITYEPNDNIYTSYMYICSHSFSMKDNGVSIDGDYVLNDYTLYPHIQYPELTQWTTGKMYWLNRWENLLTEDNIEIKNDCIYIDSYKFVRKKGIKNQHSEYGILNDGMKHNYGSKVIEATPTSYGYTLFTCKVCGYSYEDNYFYWDGTATTEPPAIGNQPVHVSSVQINNTMLSLKIGETQQLTATVSPFNADNKSVIWSSSNSSIVQVSSTGKITAKGEGNAVITVTTKDGGYTDSCNLTVSVIHVNGIALDQTSLNMIVGESQQLTATVSPFNADNKNITWSSSNSSVAQVSSTGKITAKGEGSAVITVTTKDGGYTDSCKVTVSVIHVNGISLNQTALNMVVGKSQQLTATIYPSNAENKNVIWSSSNSSVAQVTSVGKVTAKGKGSAIITVTTVDGNYSAKCTVTVTEPPLTVNISMGAKYQVSSSGSVRGMFAEATASGGSGNYVEYYIKVYYNGTLVAEGTKDEMIVTLANGTYTAEAYVKDSSGNEATASKTVSYQGY